MKELDDLDIDDVPLMERLKHKIKLHDALRLVFKTISAEQNSYPKSYTRLMLRTFVKDARKGIKIINKKNPVFVEMPKLESVGNGMIKRVNEDSDSCLSDDIVEVSIPNVSFIEDKR